VSSGRIWRFLLHRVALLNGEVNLAGAHAPDRGRNLAAPTLRRHDVALRGKNFREFVSQSANLAGGAGRFMFLDGHWKLGIAINDAGHGRLLGLLLRDVVGPLGALRRPLIKNLFLELGKLDHVGKAFRLISVDGLEPLEGLVRLRLQELRLHVLDGLLTVVLGPVRDLWLLDLLEQIVQLNVVALVLLLLQGHMVLHRSKCALVICAAPLLILPLRPDRLYRLYRLHLAGEPDLPPLLCLTLVVRFKTVVHAEDLPLRHRSRLDGLIVIREAHLRIGVARRLSLLRHLIFVNVYLEILDGARQHTDSLHLI
jgi:hypothetical protein